MIIKIYPHSPRALDPINESSNSILDDDISYDRTEDEDFLNNSALMANDSTSRKSGGKRRYDLGRVG